MAKLTEAEKVAQSEMSRVINLQLGEQRKWEGTRGFNFHTLATDPQRLFWWMLQQRRAMNPIYDQTVKHRGRSEQFTYGKQESVMQNYCGMVNEALAYWVRAAQLHGMDNDELSLDYGNTRKVIIADALYARRRGKRYAQPIGGKVIGNYQPDALRVSISEQEAIAAFEASLVNGSTKEVADYQTEKVDNIDIAKRHHPHLIPSSTFVELGVPASRMRSQVFGLEVVDLGYDKDDELVELMGMVFTQVRPHPDKPTLAELMPELRNHPTFRGEAPQYHPNPTTARRAYT